MIEYPKKSSHTTIFHSVPTKYETHQKKKNAKKMWTNNKRTPIYIKKNLLQTHLYLDLDVIV
jgi:hypothetical protein